MDSGDNTTVNMFLTSRNAGSNTPRFAITTGSTKAEQRLTGPAVLSPGQHHLAVTLSQSGSVVTGTLYVNGEVAILMPT